MRLFGSCGNDDLATVCAHSDNGSLFYLVCRCDSIIEKVVALCAVPVKHSSQI